MTVILMVVAILLIIAGFLRQIKWRELAVKWVGNDPKHAACYVNAGGTVKVYLGRRDKDNELIYTYKTSRDNVVTVIVPANYPYEYIMGRRIIGVKDGIVVASPLGYMSEADTKKYKETTVDVSTLTQSKMIINALRTIGQSKPINWITILIIGVVIIVAGYYYKTNISDKNRVPNQPVITNNITRPSTPSSIIIPPPQGTVVP